MAGTGLRHWMLHNDQLAGEYDETLKLSPGFDPVRDVDPSLSLSAPLITGPDSIPGNIKGVVGRNSEATYWAPRGAFLLPAADFESRHEYGPGDQPLGVLMEPASTNKCRNYNANIDEALEGLTLTGDSDPAATMARVADPAALKAAGLDRIASEGYAVRVDNPGPGSSRVNIDGGVGNTNVHSVSMYWRGSGSGGIRLNSVGIADAPAPANYERFTNEALTPLSAGDYAQVWIQPNSTVYFLLNQLEENVIASSDIVVLGAAASRAADQLSWPLPAVPEGFNQIEGMFAFCWRPQIGHAEIATSTADLLGSSRSALTLAYLNLGGANHRMCTQDGQPNQNCVQFPGNAINANQNYLVAGHYGAGGKEIGIKTLGAWSWSGIDSYSAPYPSEDELILGRTAAVPAHFGNVDVYTVNRGRDWIEARYQGICS